MKGKALKWALSSAAAVALCAGRIAWGQDFGERQVYSLVDLAERTEIWRNQYARMTPGEGAALQEVGWQWFEEADFPAGFLERLAGVRELGVWTWPLWAELDPVSLETVFLNAEGAEAGRVWTDFAKAESVRMALRVPLVAEEDVQDFAYREERLADGGQEVPGGGRETRSGETTNLVFTAIFETNRAVVVALTKGCPNRSSDGIGWGLMQLTKPRPTAQQLWDWRANVEGGLDLLDEKLAMASDYFAAVQRMYPSQYEPYPASYIPPGTSTALTALEAATIQNYNGGACELKEVVSPTWTNTYRSCWAFDPNAPSGSRWTFVPNANDYVRKVVLRHENGL